MHSPKKKLASNFKTLKKYRKIKYKIPIFQFIGLEKVWDYMIILQFNMQYKMEINLFLYLY